MAETTAAPVTAATGKVTSTKEGLFVFNPSGTRYELHLVGSFQGEAKSLVKCRIEVKARKVYTVPSGGGYITPIFGPPRIIQGIVRSADQRTMIVQAGTCPFHVELPAAESGIDLDDGPIYLGKMVNVVCMPGVRGQLVS